MRPTTCNIPELETPRLRLRALRLDDFDAFAAMWREPAVVRFIGGVPLAREDAWSRFLRQMGMWHYLGFGVFAVEERETGSFVGVAGFHDLHRDITPSIDGTMEAGWVLSSTVHGRGMAVEAMRAALAWADCSHATKRITCIIRPEHLASLHIAEKLGFSEFGRANYKGEPIVLLERAAGAGELRGMRA
jgi:RimJ/RimL family protein N-acetyltransferase